MKVTVYHADREFYRKEVLFTFDEGKLVDLVSKNFGTSYSAVAEVAVDKVGAAALDVAFEKTNHIDRSWQENPEVEAKVAQARSTSVGDVIVTEEGFKFLVVGVGFKLLY